jgi:hypothetical protein
MAIVGQLQIFHSCILKIIAYCMDCVIFELTKGFDMAKKRCNTCVGSGRVMGGGMMMWNCEICDGSGKVILPDDPIDHIMRKESEAYQNAKAKIKGLDDKLTDTDAEKLLDAELANLSDEKVTPITKKRTKRDGEKAG